MGFGAPGSEYLSKGRLRERGADVAAFLVYDEVTPLFFVKCVALVP